MDKNLVKIRVIYADTDAMGIVYHTNYIKWFEIGRTELFRDRGLLYKDVEHLGYALPLTQVFCHYYWPARYDDIVLLETRIAFVKRASMKFAYRIWDEKNEKLLVEGSTVHACTDRTGKIVRIPLLIMDKIEKVNSGLKERRLRHGEKIG